MGKRFFLAASTAMLVGGCVGQESTVNVPDDGGMTKPVVDAPLVDDSASAAAVADVAVAEAAADGPADSSQQMYRGPDGGTVTSPDAQPAQCLANPPGGCSGTTCSKLLCNQTGCSPYLDACQAFLDCYRSNNCGPEDPCSQGSGTCSVSSIAVSSGEQAAQNAPSYALTVFRCDCPGYPAN